MLVKIGVVAMYVNKKSEVLKILSLQILIGMMIIASFASCVGEKEKTITIFAGAASKPALDEVAQAFEIETGIKVYCSYGGSGTVLSQMKLSSTGDLYMPGSPDYIPKAERDNVINPNTSEIVAYLIPVIAVQRGNPKNIQSLSDLAKSGITVGIGNPDAVCLGLYAVEILDYNHLLIDVGKNIITQAESCDKTASLLSLKAVDAVIGWHVFHDWSPDNIDVVYIKPEQLPRIAYIPVAISTFSHDIDSSRKFINFLVSKNAQQIFSKWGYIASESNARKFAPDAAIGGEYKLPEIYKELVK
jgi:molybdate transport system substrate-binding protein